MLNQDPRSKTQDQKKRTPGCRGSKKSSENALFNPSAGFTQSRQRADYPSAPRVFPSLRGTRLRVGRGSRRYIHVLCQAPEGPFWGKLPVPFSGRSAPLNRAQKLPVRHEEDHNTPNPRWHDGFKPSGHEPFAFDAGVPAFRIRVLTCQFTTMSAVGIHGLILGAK